MGGGRWSDSDWSTYSMKSVAGKTTNEVYSRRDSKKEYLPKDIKVRESRDSADNPESNAIILGLDVTGSMSPVLDGLIRTGIPTLMTEIYARKPVKSPQILMAALGDVMCDSTPLQVTQFESDIRIAEQLQGIYLECGGGGNNSESYHLPWYFAAMHTSIDCFENRGKKGYLFTFGDEMPPGDLTPEQVRSVFGYSSEESLSINKILDMASEKYEVFHLILKEGSYARSHNVMPAWVKLLGQRAIPVNDATKLAEIIVSLIQINEGENKVDVVNSWAGDKSLAVRTAVEGYSLSKSSGIEIL